MEEAWIKGLPHRLVRVMVVTDDGSILLQLRSRSMQTAPGLWDNSAAGHVDANETYEAAATRELAEETGIQVAELKLVKEYYNEEKHKEYLLKRFNRLYEVRVEKSVQLHPQIEEVAELRWFSKEEIQDLVKNHASETTKGLIEAIELLGL